MTVMSPNWNVVSVYQVQEISSLSLCPADLMRVYARIMRNVELVFQIGHVHARILWVIEAAFLLRLVKAAASGAFPLCYDP